ncbi:acyltransferase [Alicyclobacillus acidoterrestris]|uniref:acyltransferase n=1 Tax=Alicyclobacillus acidoterrestris TaxID=1450 RepID=UPI003F52C831
MAKKYLYEIDLMRAFIMLSVLSVHTTSFFSDLIHADAGATALTLGALITSLHYTREAFMFITGLVLFITYYRRPLSVVTFWKKRFLLIVIPYVVWTIAYIVFKGMLDPDFNWSLLSLLAGIKHSLMTGDQYFLYYVVVSMQLYVVFPLLLYGLRKFERYHLHIFIGSFVIQLGLMALNKFVLQGMSYSNLPYVLAEIDKYRDRFILTYQFWFIAGGIIACHYERIRDFFDHHVRALRIALVVGLIVLWGHYLFDRLVLGEPESLAELVLQPIMIPYSLLAAANMWYAGVQWAQRRERPGWRPFSWFVKVAANASFGIFLLQPFPLYYMEWTVHHIKNLGIPNWLYFSLLPLSILFVYFSAMFIAHWLGKIPILSYVVGRKARFSQRRLGQVQSSM